MSSDGPMPMQDLGSPVPILPSRTYSPVRVREKTPAAAALPTSHTAAELISVLLDAAVTSQARRGRSFESPFDSATAPQIPVQRYLQRFSKYATSSPSIYVLCVVLIDRYLVAKGGWPTVCNIHRLWCAAFCIMAKLYDDKFFSNMHYAHVGGIPVSQLNYLERELLAGCAFHVVVGVEEFNLYVAAMKTVVSQGCFDRLKATS